MIGLIKGTARQAKTVSGLPLPIASYKNNSKLPLKELSLSINPTQSGSGDPYPAGGGKNKLPYPYAETTKTVNGVTITDIGDGSLNVNGTTTGTVWFGFDPVQSTPVTLPAGTYTFKGTGNDNIIFSVEPVGGSTFNIYSADSTVTFSEETTFGYFMTVKNGYSFSNVKIYPQIEVGSSSTSFAPYSNIRPITGVSSVNVARTGKNFIDLSLSNLEQGGINGNTGALENLSNRVRNANYYPFPFDTLYDKRTIITIPSGYKLAMRFYDKNGSYISGTGSPIGFITELQSYFYGKGVEFVKFLFARTDNANITPSDISVLTYQLEIGSIGTPYEPYTGNTYTIQLGNTYYGATLDVVRGKLSDTLDSVKLADLSWTYDTTTLSVPVFTATVNDRKTGSNQLYCEIYKRCEGSRGELNTYNNAIATWNLTSSRIIGIRDDRFTDVTSFTNALGDTLLYYEVQTPIEIDLTPTQINSLLGSNSFWHDGNGDVESLKFMDRQLYFGR